MRYRIEFLRRAMKDLRGVPNEEAVRVIKKIDALADDLSGDVKRLTIYSPEYRLRVGNYRVLLRLAANHL